MDKHINVDIFQNKSDITLFFHGSELRKLCKVQKQDYYSALDNIPDSKKKPSGYRCLSINREDWPTYFHAIIEDLYQLINKCKGDYDHEHITDWDKWTWSFQYRKEIDFAYFVYAPRETI